MNPTPDSGFDRFADDYETLHRENVKLSGFGPEYFDEHKIRTIRRLVAKEATGALQKQSLSFLNYGCGIGKSERYITQYFPGARVLGADISPRSLDAARNRNRDLAKVSYLQITSTADLAGRGPFDIILAANVFHHIPGPEHISAMAPLMQSLAPGGCICIFEHNPLNPLTARAFSMCPFDKDCTMISPRVIVGNLRAAGCGAVKMRYVLFFPKFLQALEPLERFLWWLPLGAQYCVRCWRRGDGGEAYCKDASQIR
jgi:SAM-dependent methyltransferase